MKTIMKNMIVALITLASISAYADPFILALQTEEMALRQQIYAIEQQMSQQEQMDYTVEDKKVLNLVRKSNINLLKMNVLRVNHKIRDIQNAQAQANSQQQP